jgi:Tfp pilus assembly protein PilV
MSTHRTGRRGATLVEAMCATFILTIGVFGAIDMYIRAMDETKAVAEHGAVMRALSNEIETLRAAPFAELREGAEPFRSQTPEIDHVKDAVGTVRIAPEEGVPGLMQVCATLRWRGEHGRAIEKSLTTLIAEKR